MRTVAPQSRIRHAARSIRELAMTLLLFLTCPPVFPGTADCGVGVNLSGVNDYASQLVFVDLFRQSRPWLTAAAGGGGAWDTVMRIPLRADGYPAHVPFTPPGDLPQIVHTLMARDIGGHYPAGVYTLMFEGRGALQVGLDAEAGLFETSGAHPVRVRPSNAGVSLRILRSDPDDPVRGIRFVMPGFADTYGQNPFFPPFLDRLAPFSVLRFMDMQGVNADRIPSWEARTTPDSATQSGPEGVAGEFLFELCSRTGASPWLCIPHNADDTYARNLAQMALARLKPGSKLYLEYSNEVWNAAFPQFRHVRRQGQILGLDADPFVSGIRYGVKRALELFAIFDAVCQDRLELVKVVAGQAANPYVAAQALQSLDMPAINPEGMRIDALAIAPYLGHDIADELGRTGKASYAWPTEVLAALEAELPALEEGIAAHRKLADARGLRLVAYEGGQHLAARTPEFQNDETLTDLLVRTNADPGMGALYRKLIAAWRRNGGGLFTYFALAATPGKYGSWGLLEWTEQPVEQAPKYRAAMEAGCR